MAGLLKRLYEKYTLFQLLQFLRPVSYLLIFVSFVWLLLLPADFYSSKTYISENAILPGQVNSNFGAEMFKIRTKTAKLREYIEAQDPSWANELLEIYNEYGIQAEAHSIDDVIDSSTTKKGTVVHAIIRATRSDTVESMVLSVPTRISTDPKLSNANAIELSVALAIHFSEMHIWSKDVVIITSDLGEYGVYKWLQSHLLLDTDNSKGYQKYRVGAIQGAVGLEIPPGTNFDKIGLYYEGKDGQLSNLDLPNTAAIIFGFQNFEALNHGSKSCHKLTSDFEKYKCVFWNLIRGMKVLAFGSNHGTQAPFLEYRIDAISVIAIPRDVDGNIDSSVASIDSLVRIGISIESLFRSINNLLEHFHQSFFLYLLPDSKRYISIGNYIVPVILMTVAILLKGLSMLAYIIPPDETMPKDRVVSLTKTYKLVTTSLCGSGLLFLFVLCYTFLVFIFTDYVYFYRFPILNLRFHLISLFSILLFIKRADFKCNRFSLMFLACMYAALCISALSIINFSLSLYSFFTVGLPLVLLPVKPATTKSVGINSKQLFRKESSDATTYKQVQMALSTRSNSLLYKLLLSIQATLLILVSPAGLSLVSLLLASKTATLNFIDWPTIILQYKIYGHSAFYFSSFFLHFSINIISCIILFLQVF